MKKLKLGAMICFWRRNAIAMAQHTEGQGYCVITYCTDLVIITSVWRFFFFFFLLLCFLSIILVFAWALGNANRSFLGQQLFRVCQLD